MPSAARSSRLAVRSPRELRASGHDVHSSRRVAPPRDKHGESRARPRAPPHDRWARLCGPKARSPRTVESVRCGSASGTIPLAPAIRSRRRPREGENHESRAAGHDDACRASAERSSGFGSIRGRQTTGFGHIRAPQRQCRTTPFVLGAARVASLLWRRSSTPTASAPACAMPHPQEGSAAVGINAESPVNMGDS
jgi:hypothetical protein